MCGFRISHNKSNIVHVATSASASSAFLDFDLVMRAYIDKRLQVMPNLTATAVGMPWVVTCRISEVSGRERENDDA